MQNKTMYRWIWYFFIVFIFSTVGISVKSYALTQTQKSRLSAGANHSLYLKCDGTVSAWGLNDKGQLGDNTIISKKKAVAVKNLTNVIAVAGGGSHSLALRSDGFVWAWGANDKGQLGDGTNTDSKIPVRVNGISNVIAIAAGNKHSLALLANGTVRAWGANLKGQLGDGTNDDSNVPVTVKNSVSGIAIACGDEFSLALVADGTVQAWGANASGQLGDGTNNDSKVLVTVDIDEVTAIACGGSHCLATKTDGSLYAWGSNSSGQLGINSLIDQNTPKKITLLQEVAAIEGGGLHSIAIKTDGNVYTWGKNASGQLGMGNTTDLKTPKKIATLKNIKAVAAGLGHSLALGGNDAVFGWGENASGQVGNNQTKDAKKPVNAVGLMDSIVAFAAGRYHNLVVKDDGSVWSFGSNVFEQLGHWTYGVIGASAPVKVMNLTGIKKVAGGWWFSLALDSKGKVWSWGYNDEGELGDGTTVLRNDPVAVAGLTNVSAIAAGAYHALALKKDGTVWAWGYNGDGQLGTGDNDDRLKPTQVSGLANVTAIACGSLHNLALKNDGTVLAWGSNLFGQLGNGLTTASNVPVAVGSIANAQSVGAGDWHSLISKADGSTWAWGLNDNGQIGDNTTTTRLLPTMVSGLFNVKSVACGAVHSAALKKDGTVWTWGYNGYGQLGNGNYTQSNLPVLLGGAAFKNNTAIACGGYHSVTYKSDKSLWACGYDWDGEVGDGPHPNTYPFYAVSTPKQVMGFCEVLLVEASKYNCYVLRGDGTVWSWGNNGYTSLGDGSDNRRDSPVKVLNIKDIVSISSFGNTDEDGGWHVLALSANGTVYGWGRNLEGQLGDGSTSTSAVPVISGGLPGDIIQISAGSWHSLALDTHGGVWGWGYNANGQLGDGTTNNRTLAQPVGFGVAGFTDIVAVSAGGRHSLFLKRDGTIWGCGNNNEGQLGDGTFNTPKTTPVQMGNLSDNCGIYAGGNHSLILRSFGVAFSCGANWRGQLGDGGVTNKNNPGLVGGAGFNNLISIAPSRDHTLFLKADGKVWACGRNIEGEIGDNTGSGDPGVDRSRLFPVRTKATSSVTSIAAGGYHSVARNSDGGVEAWGYGANGQQGNGSNGTQYNPMPVNGL